MTKIATALIVGALVLIAGFLYLKSQPAPAPLSTNQESSIKETPSQSITMPATKQYPQPPQMQIDTKKTYTASIKTSKGDLRIKLFATETPVTVNNFVFLAKDGFYNQTTFHRIIKDFMVQAGDPQGDGTGGPGYQFDDEAITKDYTRGIVAMANAGANTNGSQFFIVHQDANLPKNYVIFGELADENSLKTLDAIASTPVINNPNTREPNSYPTEKVTVESITIEEK